MVPDEVYLWDSKVPNLSMYCGKLEDEEYNSLKKIHAGLYKGYGGKRIYCSKQNNSLF